MKIDYDCINYNAVRMIKELLECRYEVIEDGNAKERGFLLMTMGEIAGIVEFAECMKEGEG